MKKLFIYFLEAFNCTNLLTGKIILFVQILTEIETGQKNHQNLLLKMNKTITQFLLFIWPSPLKQCSAQR